MATKTVDVEIDYDLDDFELYELFEEIQERASKNRNNDLEVKEFCREFLNEDDELIVETVEDELKLEVIKEALKKYSLTQLEEKLK